MSTMCDHGALLFLLSRTRKKPMGDPIEASALHNGRLSLTDSILVLVQNLISNGFGARQCRQRRVAMT